MDAPPSTVDPPCTVCAPSPRLIVVAVARALAPVDKAEVEAYRAREFLPIRAKIGERARLFVRSPRCSGVWLRVDRVFVGTHVAVVCDDDGSEPSRAIRGCARHAGGRAASVHDVREFSRAPARERGSSASAGDPTMGTKPTAITASLPSASPGRGTLLSVETPLYSWVAERPLRRTRRDATRSARR